MDELKSLPPAFFPVLIGMVSVMMLVTFLVYFLFIKNLRDTLAAVRPQNRQMQPSQVWLLLLSFLGVFIAIPGLMVEFAASGMYTSTFVITPAMVKNMEITQNVIAVLILLFQYKVVTKLADSIAREYASRNMQVEARPTYQAGLIYCICSFIAAISSFFTIKWIGMLASFGGFFFLVLYWLKTAQYKKALRNMPANPDEGDSLFTNLY